jgi:shikimate dehydrogenase
MHKISKTSNALDNISGLVLHAATYMHNNFIMAGVMGWPVAHSRSPNIHNYWIDHHKLNGAYGLFPVKPQDLQTAIKGLKALGLAGCNLTIPHKVNAMRFVDNVDPLAKRIGAINTIVVKPDGELHGFNNDAFGYIESLREALPAWHANAGPVVLLGAGGAARAIIVGLISEGATEIRLINRTKNKADEIASEFTGTVQAYEWQERHDALNGCALLINTTSLGMHGQETLDLQLDQLPQSALVSDVIYAPLETALLMNARLRGNATVNGLGMLLHQARPAFNAWFGVMPEVTAELRQVITATF